MGYGLDGWDFIPCRFKRFLSPRHSLYIYGLDGWILFPAGAIVFLFSAASRSVVVFQTPVL
jgi:hypothetical protein